MGRIGEKLALLGEGAMQSVEHRGHGLGQGRQFERVASFFRRIQFPIGSGNCTGAVRQRLQRAQAAPQSPEGEAARNHQQQQTADGDVEQHFADRPSDRGRWEKRR